MVATVWGLASMGSGFGGMLFSWLSGRLIDHHGYTPVFIMYGVMPLASATLVLFAMGPLQPLSIIHYDRSNDSTPVVPEHVTLLCDRTQP
jgi:hypothetical protein